MDILTQLKDNQDWKKLRTVFTSDEIRDLADIQTRINKLEDKIEERLKYESKDYNILKPYITKNSPSKES